MIRPIKNILLCLVTFVLSSCANIAVSDFGSYWGRGYVDPALVGEWQMTTPKSNDDREEARSIKGSVLFSDVSNDNGTYRIESLLQEERENKDYQPAIGRILDVGKYKFFMTGSLKDLQDDQLKSGMMIRFTFTNRQLLAYDLDGMRVKAFLEANHPANKNIEAGCAEWSKPVAPDNDLPPVPADKPKKDCQIFNTRIKIFDESVFKILETIPDTPAYWSVSKDYGNFLIGNHKK